MRSLLALVVFGGFLAGCHAREALKDLGDPAVQQKLGEQINKVITQPANPFPWVELIQTVGGLVVGATVGHQTGKRSGKKAARQATAPGAPGAPAGAPAPAVTP